MDKNSIVGIVLIAAIFVVFGIFNKPSKETQEKQQRRNDSIALVKEIQDKEAELTALKQQQNVTPGGQSQLTDSTLVIIPQDAFNYRDICLENNKIKICISEKGGRPGSVSLKEYFTYDSLPVTLFHADSSSFGLNFFVNNRPVNTQNLYFKADTGKDTVVAKDGNGSLTLRYTQEEGKYIEYRYSIEPDKYQVDLQIVFNNMDNITTLRQGTVDLDWMILSPQQEKGRDNEMQYTTLYYKPFEDDVSYFSARSKKDLQTETIPTKVEWVAYKDQFFSSVLMTKDAFQDATLKMESTPKGSRYMKKFESSLGLPYQNGPQHKVDLSFYFGPNKYKLLKSQYGDKRLHELVTVGKNIIKWINQIVIINLFDFLSKFISSYGIIILIMTIIIKVVLLPLTFKSYQSTAKMKVLKPQIDEINERIPKEKAMERQQATMALYKKVGVSPMGGCLPMLLQMPILFAMFRFFPTSIELRQQSFLWATDLSTYDAILEWDRYIPFITNSFGNHISLFTLLMTISTIISMKFTNQSNVSNQQMPGMQTMMYIMPVMFMFVLNKFSAGLTYYYFLTNVFTIGQNYLFKAFINEEDLLKKLESKKSVPKKKSKFQQRLEEMAKQQGYKPAKKKK
jgi:YidC/Oxa1 family membrane protein insertase